VPETAVSRRQNKATQLQPDVGNFEVANNLTYGSPAVKNEDTISSVTTSGTYRYDVVKDSDSTAPVLNDADDRLKLVFVASKTGTGGGDLEPGEEVTVKINTASGASTTIRFSIPDSLAEKSAVEL
jgi:archaellin